MNSHTMQTYTGKLIDLTRFCEDDVRLPDISHALSLISRFTGHTRVPYSVASHSVMVSYLVDPPYQLWGLLHDASEAYLGDVARPLKTMLPSYCLLEERVQRVIARKFHLPWPMPAEVHTADQQALLAEKRDLMSVVHDWNIEATPADKPVRAVSWEDAKREFETRFKELWK